jgi:DNA-binding SARP family transcriptional activator
LDGSTPVRMLHRERLLVAFLALHGSRHRCHVAGVLWPEVDERNARSSLRQSLHAVRQVAPGLIDSETDSLALSISIETDVDEVRMWCDLLERGEPVPPACAVEALRVLEGPELMLGVFDDWVLAERERIQRARTRALEMLAGRLADAAPLHAIAACEVAARIEPLGEGPATTLVALHLAIGNRVDAMRAYHAFRERLWDEMRIEPSPKMTALLA